MADENTDKSRKRRRVVKRDTETVRQKAAKQAGEAGAEKPKRIRGAAKKASSPFKAIGRFLKKIFRPFRFLLKPFKTRPARAIGRFLARVLFINYIRASWQEVKLVTWPDRRNTIKLTFAVFMFAIVFATMIAIVDFGLDKIFKSILL